MPSTLSGTDVIQTESLENLNFVVIFELLPIARNERAVKLRIADLGRVVALTAGMLLLKLTISHIDYTQTRTLQLCFVSRNKIRIQFLFHGHSGEDYLNHC